MTFVDVIRCMCNQNVLPSRVFNPVINQTEALTHARLGLFQCDVLAPWSILNFPNLCIDFQSVEPKEYISELQSSKTILYPCMSSKAGCSFSFITGNAFRWKVCAREQFFAIGHHQRNACRCRSAKSFYDMSRQFAL